MRLMSSVRCQASSGRSSAGPRSTMPALLTRMSIRPKAVERVGDGGLDGRLIGDVAGEGLGALAESLRPSPCAAFSLMSMTPTTRALRRKCFERWRPPMPEAPPVTSATLPVSEKFRSIGCSLRHGFSRSKRKMRLGLAAHPTEGVVRNASRAACRRSRWSPGSTARCRSCPLPPFHGMSGYCSQICDCGL